MMTSFGEWYFIGWLLYRLTRLDQLVILQTLDFSHIAVNQLLFTKNNTFCTLLINITTFIIRTDISLSKEYSSK